MSVSESQNVSLISRNISQSMSGKQHLINSEVKILNLLSKIKYDFEHTFEESYQFYIKHFEILILKLKEWTQPISHRHMTCHLL